MISIYHDPGKRPNFKIENGFCDERATLKLNTDEFILICTKRI